jgi:two-component system chemotaxis response regulator CheB
MDKKFYIVGIGASAGGLNALKEFFDHIPEDTPAAFIVVTHLSRNYYSILANLLAVHTKLAIARVDKDVQIQPGHIYVLTENTALRIADGWLKVEPRDQKIMNSSVDIFFKSLATEFKERAIGVVLSGGGDDGLEGALQLFESGGNVMAQTLLSAQVTGMPRAIIDHDHPTAILSPAKLAKEIVRLCKSDLQNT